MGYFSNGCEGDAYYERYCARCVHDLDNNCPVWLAHLLHNYSELQQSAQHIAHAYPTRGRWVLQTMQNVYRTQTKMNTADIIKTLKKGGFGVDIDHNREFWTYGNGITTVEITDFGSYLVDGEPKAKSYIVYRGVARCSKKDCYCKKTGVRIAMNRALDRLAHHNKEFEDLICQ